MILTYWFTGLALVCRDFVIVAIHLFLCEYFSSKTEYFSDKYYVCLQPPNEKAKKSSIFPLKFCVLLFLYIFFAFYRFFVFSLHFIVSLHFLCVLSFLCIFFAFYCFFVCDAPINSRHRHPLVSSQTSQEAPESIFCLVAASWNIFLVNQPMTIRNIFSLCGGSQ